MSVILHTSDGEVYNWVAIGGWEQRRSLQEEGLRFCWESDIESAYRFRYEHLEQGGTDKQIPWEELQDIVLDEQEIDNIIKQTLDQDANIRLNNRFFTSKFHQVMQSYGYAWSEYIFQPSNIADNMNQRLIIKR